MNKGERTKKSPIKKGKFKNRLYHKLPSISILQSGQETNFMRLLDFQKTGAPNLRKQDNHRDMQKSPLYVKVLFQISSL